MVKYLEVWNEIVIWPFAQTYHSANPEGGKENKIQYHIQWESFLTTNSKTRSSIIVSHLHPHLSSHPSSVCALFLREYKPFKNVESGHLGFRNNSICFSSVDFAQNTEGGEGGHRPVGNVVEASVLLMERTYAKSFNAVTYSLGQNEKA